MVKKGLLLKKHLQLKNKGTKPTLFEIEMAKIDTLFMIQTAEKP